MLYVCENKFKTTLLHLFNMYCKATFGYKVVSQRFCSFGFSSLLLLFKLGTIFMQNLVQGEPKKR